MSSTIQCGGWHDEPDVAFLMMSCEALVSAAETFPKSTVINLDRCVRAAYGLLDSPTWAEFRGTAQCGVALANAREALNLLIEAEAATVLEDVNGCLELRLTVGAWAAMNTFCTLGDIENLTLWELLEDYRVPKRTSDEFVGGPLDAGRSYLAAALSKILGQSVGPIALQPENG